MGNITTFWEFCREHGLKVFSSNSDFEDIFEKNDESIRKKTLKM